MINNNIYQNSAKTGSTNSAPSVGENKNLTEIGNKLTKTILYCRCFSNNCKLSMFGLIYIAAYLFLFMCIYLRISSENRFTMYNAELMQKLSVSMPGPFIPDKCEDKYMHNCARVSFDGCKEKLYNEKSWTCSDSWFW